MGLWRDGEEIELGQLNDSAAFGSVTRSRENQGFVWTFLKISNPSISPWSLSVVSHLPVTVGRLRLSGIIRGYQEQIISEKPGPCFRAFNFQLA